MGFLSFCGDGESFFWGGRACFFFVGGGLPPFKFGGQFSQGCVFFPPPRGLFPTPWPLGFIKPPHFLVKTLFFWGGKPPPPLNKTFFPVNFFFCSLGAFSSFWAFLGLPTGRPVSPFGGGLGGWAPPKERIGLWTSSFSTFSVAFPSPNQTTNPFLGFSPPCPKWFHGLFDPPTFLEILVGVYLPVL